MSEEKGIASRIFGRQLKLDEQNHENGETDNSGLLQDSSNDEQTEQQEITQNDMKIQDQTGQDAHEQQIAEANVENSESVETVNVDGQDVKEHTEEIGIGSEQPLDENKMQDDSQVLASSEEAEVVPEAESIAENPETNFVQPQNDLGQGPESQPEISEQDRPEDGNSMDGDNGQNDFTQQFLEVMAYNGEEDREEDGDALQEHVEGDEEVDGIFNQTENNSENIAENVDKPIENTQELHTDENIENNEVFSNPEESNEDDETLVLNFDTSALPEDIHQEILQKTEIKEAEPNLDDIFAEHEGIAEQNNLHGSEQGSGLFDDVEADKIEQTSLFGENIDYVGSFQDNVGENANDAELFQKSENNFEEQHSLFETQEGYENSDADQSDDDDSGQEEDISNNTEYVEDAKQADTIFEDADSETVDVPTLPQAGVDEDDNEEGAFGKVEVLEVQAEIVEEDVDFSKVIDEFEEDEDDNGVVSKNLEEAATMIAELAAVYPQVQVINDEINQFLLNNIEVITKERIAICLEDGGISLEDYMHFFTDIIDKTRKVLVYTKLREIEMQYLFENFIQCFEVKEFIRTRHTIDGKVVNNIVKLQEDIFVDAYHALNSIREVQIKQVECAFILSDKLELNVQDHLEEIKNARLNYDDVYIAVLKGSVVDDEAVKEAERYGVRIINIDMPLSTINRNLEEIKTAVV